MTGIDNFQIQRMLSPVGSNINVINPYVNILFPRVGIVLVLFALALSSLPNRLIAEESTSLKSTLHKVVDSTELTTEEKADELKNIYAQAIIDNRLTTAGLALYHRGNQLLYLQNIEAYENWLSVHQQFSTTYQLEATPFFIEKLELSRLFHQMKTLELETRAKELLDRYPPESIRQATTEPSSSYRVHLYDIAEIYNLLGLAQHDLGKYASSIQSFRKALELYEEAGSTFNIPIVYGNLALVQSSVGDLASAIEYNQKAIEYSSRSGNLYSFLKASTNQSSYQLSMLYGLNKNNKEHAVLREKLEADLTENLRSILQHPKIQEFPVIHCDALFWLSSFYLHINQLNSAKSELSTLNECIKKLSDETYKKQVDELNAYYLFEIGSFEEGITLLTNALNFYRQHNKSDKILSTLLDLSWAYEQVKQFDISLQFYQEYTRYLEKSFDDQRMSAIAKEQAKSNSLVREKELLLLKEKQRAIELQNKNNRRLYVFSTITGSLLLLFFWSQLRAKKALVRQYQRLSHTDSLTQIGNRLHFSETIERELAQVKRLSRENVEEKLVLFILDIDYFKQLNDSHGHDVGDGVLVDFAERLKMTIRESDLLARWGGEEFVVTGKVSSENEIKQYATRILQAINSKPFLLRNGKTQYVTCSLGGTVYPFFKSTSDQPHWEKLLILADKALYQAKESGRNTFVVFVGNVESDNTPISQFIEQPTSKLPLDVIKG